MSKTTRRRPAGNPYEPPRSPVGPGRSEDRARLPLQAYSAAFAVGLHVTNALVVIQWAALYFFAAGRMSYSRFATATAACGGVGVAAGVVAGMWSVRRARRRALAHHAAGER